MDIFLFVSATFLLFVLVVEVLRLFLRWCFRRLDDYFRDRYIRIIMENMDRLERIAEDAA